MTIKDTTIGQYKQVHCITKAKERTTMYTGKFNCPGKSLHGEIFQQVSSTGVLYFDEHGKAHWGNPETLFKLPIDDIKFKTLEDLVTFYNDNHELKAIKHMGVSFQVSDSGTVIFAEGKQLFVSRIERGANHVDYRISFKGKRYRVRRLVAFAFHGKPKSERMRVILRDGDYDNLHYSNLYYSFNSVRPEDRTPRQSGSVRDLRIKKANQ